MEFTKAPVFVDPAVAERKNMVTGANEDGFHLKGVDVARDLLGHGKVADLRTVKAGELCAATGEELKIRRAIEVGHVFKLGTKYSESLGSSFLDADGQHPGGAPLQVRDVHRWCGLGRLRRCLRAPRQVGTDHLRLADHRGLGGDRDRLLERAHLERQVDLPRPLIEREGSTHRSRRQSPPSPA